MASRGIRNNNPGNIEYGNFAKAHGATGTDGRFAKFATPEMGIAAMYALQNRYENKGLTTVQQRISRWAPSNENNTTAYVNRVAAAMGIGPNAPFSLSDPTLGPAFIAAIIQHENGSQPYALETIKSAYSETGKVFAPDNALGTTTIGRNSSPDRIIALQTALQAAGFNPGTIDGKWGRNTRFAVEQMQRALGLTIDGRPGPTTLGKLSALVSSGRTKDDDLGPAPGTFVGPNGAAGNSPRPRPTIAVTPEMNAAQPNFALRADHPPNPTVAAPMSYADFNRASGRVVHPPNPTVAAPMSYDEFNRASGIVTHPPNPTVGTASGLSGFVSGLLNDGNSNSFPGKAADDRVVASPASNVLGYSPSGPLGGGGWGEALASASPLMSGFAGNPGKMADDGFGGGSSNLSAASGPLGGGGWGAGNSSASIAAAMTGTAAHPGKVADDAYGGSLYGSAFSGGGNALTSPSVYGVSPTPVHTVSVANSGSAYGPPAGTVARSVTTTPIHATATTPSVGPTVGTFTRAAPLMSGFAGNSGKEGDDYVGPAKTAVAPVSATARAVPTVTAAAPRRTVTPSQVPANMSLSGLLSAAKRAIVAAPDAVKNIAIKAYLGSNSFAGPTGVAQQSFQQGAKSLAGSGLHTIPAATAAIPTSPTQGIPPGYMITEQGVLVPISSLSSAFTGGGGDHVSGGNPTGVGYGPGGYSNSYGPTGYQGGIYGGAAGASIAQGVGQAYRNR